MKALLVLLLLTSVAYADDERSKKDQYWADKQGDHPPLRSVNRKKLVGKKPGKVITIWNNHTDEWYAIAASAKTIPQADVERLLRCHFTNEPTTMDKRLGKVLLDAARHFDKRRINIVSGYRAPKYNLILRKKGRRVARDSEHTHGNAVDFYIPGVSTEELYQWEMANQIGGVGKYVSDGWVHVDTGRKRTWIDP